MRIQIIGLGVTGGAGKDSQSLIERIEAERRDAEKREAEMRATVAFQNQRIDEAFVLIEILRASNDELQQTVKEYLDKLPRKSEGAVIRGKEDELSVAGRLARRLTGSMSSLMVKHGNVAGIAAYLFTWCPLLAVLYMGDRLIIELSERWSPAVVLFIKLLLVLSGMVVITTGLPALGGALCDPSCNRGVFPTSTRRRRLGTRTWACFWDAGSRVPLASVCLA